MSELEETQQDGEAGSFATGFTFGMLAGAFGLYLFGTKDGANIRTKIVKEWELAKEHVVDEIGQAVSGDSVEPTTIRELALLAKRKFFLVLDGVESTANKSRVSRPVTKKDAAKTSSEKTVRSKKKLFKGV